MSWVPYRAGPCFGKKIFIPDTPLESIAINYLLSDNYRFQSFFSFLDCSIEESKTHKKPIFTLFIQIAGLQMSNQNRK
jgi:hypothetical protein